MTRTEARRRVYLRGSRNGWAPVVDGRKTVAGWLPYTEAHFLYHNELRRLMASDVVVCGTPRIGKGSSYSCALSMVTEERV